MNSTTAIDRRYSGLASGTTCLSCGGAINYADPQPGEICLDLGSGRGNDCIRLAKCVGSAGRVYGVDISRGMLDTARRNVSDKGITTVEFLESPIEIIPLPDNSVNLIISNCTINHAQNKPAVWAEIFRILKTKGRFVVSDIYSLDPVPSQYSQDPVAVSECWAGAVTREQYLQTLEHSGFENIAVLEESNPYPKGSITVSSLTVQGYKP